MEALLAFGAALLAFRFAGELAGRWRRKAHLDLVPEGLLAIAGNTLGTIAPGSETL